MLIDPFVEQKIDELTKNFTSVYPKYLFHYSDIINIKSILEIGFLYSRNYAQNNKLLNIDSADQKVIGNTSQQYLNYCRLYFRHKTPPLWQVEGFGPNNNSASPSGAHCPVPIYLLFNSKKILSLPNVEFSDGNIAINNSIIYKNIKDLEKLNFEKIFHIGWYDKLNNKNLDIPQKRCAEVIIPQLLILDELLEFIVCRSNAERETLLNFLNEETRIKYSNIIRTNSLFFNCKKHYIEKVNLLDNSIIIDYNNSRLAPFDYKYTFITSKGEAIEQTKEPVPKWFWKNPQDSYTMKVHIDDHIAYLGHFSE